MIWTSEDQDLAQAFARVINVASRENRSDTQDFVLGEMLVHHLKAYEEAKERSIDLGGLVSG
jgi:hypothetical protein